MRTGWAQRPHGFVVLQEVRKIRRVTSVQSFEGQGGKFKPYTPFNRKPEELFKKFTWRQFRRMCCADVTGILGYEKVWLNGCHKCWCLKTSKVWLTASCDNLCLHRADIAKFLCRYVAIKETVAHHFDSETKLQKRSISIKYCKTASGGKVMVSVLWDTGS